MPGHAIKTFAIELQFKYLDETKLVDMKQGIIFDEFNDHWN